MPAPRRCSFLDAHHRFDVSRLLGGTVLAMAVALLWNAWALRIGPRLGFLDTPDDPILKAHRRPAVPLGGIGVFMGVHLFLVIVDQFDAGLLAASAMVLILGLKDDRRPVQPVLRLLVETGAALILVALSPALVGRNLLYRLLAAGLVIVSINAVNLFDGLDGLVGSSGIVAGLGLWWLGDLRGGEALLGIALAAALAGFLAHNWHPAKIFLGDQGSYVVGLLLAFGAVVATPEGSYSDLLLAAGVLGVFAFDLVVTILRRQLHRRPLFAGDRSHLYDQIVDRGLSVRQVALLAGILEAGFVAVILIMDRGSDGWIAVTGLSLLVVVLLGAAWLCGFLMMSSTSGT